MKHLLGLIIFAFGMHSQIVANYSIAIYDCVTIETMIVMPDCPILLEPADNEFNVSLDVANNNSINFSWQNVATDADVNNFWIGTDLGNLNNLGGLESTDNMVSLINLEFETTYYWSIVPENGLGSSDTCSVFAFTTAAENQTDSDGDGVPDAIDCDPNDENLYQGASCDDGNEETFNDVISNSCVCEGALPLPGQFCTNALTVEEGSFSNAGPQNYGGFNDGCFIGATAGLWYLYTASADGVVEVTSDGNEVDTRLSIFDDCDSELCLFSSDDISLLENPSSSVFFEVFQGETFYIQWDNFWTNSGFTFSIILNEDPEDIDGDGIFDGLDNCSEISNVDQTDLDNDGIGDVCDLDIDGDFTPNVEDCAPNDPALFSGASCDDGNDSTLNDKIQDDCSCVGIIPEANTNCETSILIGLGEHSTLGPLIGDGASNICFNEAINAVWYEYQATQDGVLTVSSAADIVDTRLSLYNSCPAINCLGSSDDVSFPLIPGSSVSVPIVSGQSYWIEWDDQWSIDGFDFILSFESSDGDGDGIYNEDDNCPYEANPDQADLDGDGIGDVCDLDIDGDGTNNNTDCAPLDGALYPYALCDDGDPLTQNDQILFDCSCEGTIPATNQLCATAIDVGEGSFTDPGPFAGGGAGNVCDNGASNANWYRYTPSESGYSIIYSCIDIEDTRISVYSGDCDDLTCIAFNDDECGVGTNYASVVVFNVEAGQSYYFEWDDRWSIQGFNFVIINNSDVTDTDGDGIVDQEDNCFEIANPDQADLDQDFVGDVCDDDLDGDLVPNDIDCDPLDGTLFNGASCEDGNSLTFYDTIQEDCTCQGVFPDEDSDLDGIVDVFDNCTDIANADQLDMDNDGMGDLCDLDIDGDFVLNTVDCDPLNIALNEIVGSSCNDGSDETLNDVIVIGCTCLGVVPDENTNCSTAETISTGTFSSAGPITGSGASNLCGSNGNDAVWYEYVAQGNGFLSISSSNLLGINTNLSVYSGCDGICLGSNDNISDADLGSNVIIEVEEGQSYLFEFDDLWSGSGFDFVVEFIVGVPEFSNDGISDFILFPNPTSEEINVLLTAEISGEITLAITDAAGRLILSQASFLKYGENSEKFDLTMVDQGLYFLNIRSDKINFTKRFVVIK